MPALGDRRQRARRRTPAPARDRLGRERRAADAGSARTARPAATARGPSPSSRCAAARAGRSAAPRRGQLAAAAGGPARAARSPGRRTRHVVGISRKVSCRGAARPGRAAPPAWPSPGTASLAQPRSTPVDPPQRRARADHGDAARERRHWVSAPAPGRRARTSATRGAVARRRTAGRRRASAARRRPAPPSPERRRARAAGRRGCGAPAVTSTNGRCPAVWNAVGPASGSAAGGGAPRPRSRCRSAGTLARPIGVIGRVRPWARLTQKNSRVPSRSGRRAAGRAW